MKKTSRQENTQREPNPPNLNQHFEHVLADISFDISDSMMFNHADIDTGTNGRTFAPNISIPWKKAVRA